MTRLKTHPVNNWHCFEGVGKAYWLAIAKGHMPPTILFGRDGARLDLPTDTDGNAVRNGGMVSPQECKMHPGIYFRFFGTTYYNVYEQARRQAKGGHAALHSQHDTGDADTARPPKPPGNPMAGGWWIDYENAVRVRDWADRHDVSMSQAASRLLAVPFNWQDCGFVVRAQLKVQMKAWVGQGAPASADLSPDSAARRASGGAVILSLPLQEIKQYFVPCPAAKGGETSLLEKVFEMGEPVRVLSKRVALPKA